MTKITAVMAACALALGACGSSDKNSSATGSSGGGGGYGGSSAADSTASGGSNEVELYDNYFKPKTVSGKPGSTVTLELKNEGKAEHTFTVDAQKIDEELAGGKDAKISVKIPASGSVQFYCKYHKSVGMVGSLTAK